MDKQIKILEDLETEYEIVSNSNYATEQDKLLHYMKFKKQKEKVEKMQKQLQSE